MKQIRSIMKGIKRGGLILVSIITISTLIFLFWQFIGGSLYNSFVNSNIFNFLKKGNKEIMLQEAQQEIKQQDEETQNKKSEESAKVEDSNRQTNTVEKDTAKQENYKYNVDVYFTNLEKEAAEKDGKIHVYPLKRGTNDDAVATFCLNEILKGPTEDEKSQGYYSELVFEDGKVDAESFKIKIVNKIAYVDFAKPLKFYSDKSRDRVKLQIEQTLLQFHTIKSVVITVQGKPL